jgi:hypothetical protein
MRPSATPSQIQLISITSLVTPVRWLHFYRIPMLKKVDLKKLASTQILSLLPNFFPTLKFSKIPNNCIVLYN